MSDMKNGNNSIKYNTMQRQVNVLFLLYSFSISINLSSLMENKRNKCFERIEHGKLLLLLLNFLSLNFFFLFSSHLG